MFTEPWTELAQFVDLSAGSAPATRIAVIGDMGGITQVSAARATSSIASRVANAPC